MQGIKHGCILTLGSLINYSSILTQQVLIEFSTLPPHVAQLRLQVPMDMMSLVVKL